MARKSTPLENLDHNLALGILVDPEDIDLLETYRFRNASGYPMAEINRKGIYLHRLVHSRMTGKPLSEYTRKDYVRHIDPNGFDCCRSNLFEKTGATANQCDVNVALSSDNTSGIHGVDWHKPTKRWRVCLVYLYRQIYLGLYDTIEEAARVAIHCRTIRSEITCADTEMDFDTMKALLRAAAKTIVQPEGNE